MEKKAKHHYWMGRTLCDVLEEMRKCNETRNYCALAGLIEEAQSMGNRMEHGLSQKATIEQLTKKAKALSKEYNYLVEKFNKKAGFNDDED